MHIEVPSLVNYTYPLKIHGWKMIRFLSFQGAALFLFKGVLLMEEIQATAVGESNFFLI